MSLSIGDSSDPPSQEFSSQESSQGYKRPRYGAAESLGLVGRPLRRFRGPNVPPGLFAHIVNMPRRYRRNGVKPYQRNKRRGRAKYPRAGSRAIAMRPRMGAVVPSEVKRQYVESSVQTWPVGSAGPGLPARSPVYCPFSYQFWQRGLSDSQFSGSKLTLKNISVMMQLVPPVNVPTDHNKPYRFRIVQGWCKQNPTAGMSSTASSPILAASYPNGMAVNQVAPVSATLLRGGATLSNEPLHVQTLLRAQSDFVGIYGNHQNEASYTKNMYMVLSDRTVHMSPQTETPAVAPATGMDRQFKPLVLKYNFTCNKQLRVSPMTTAVADPPTNNAEWFSPINTPGQWIPFISISILNSTTDFDATAQLPTVKFTENTFFLDN